MQYRQEQEIESCFSPFEKKGADTECVFKKCCKKYKKRGYHCKKCPKR